MIVAFFKRVRRFLLRAAGITALAESQAASQATLAGLSAALDELRPVLWEHSQLLRQLAQQGATLERRYVEEQWHNRRSLDAHMKSLHVHMARVEASHQLVSQMATSLTDLGMDRWKLQEFEGLLRHLRKSLYETAVAAGQLAVPVVETDHPVAVDTDDSRFPWGAKNDNSICLKFNTRLYQLFPARQRIAVLDLGCAGGGFVRSLIDDGHLAVGIEGCDLPKKNRLGEWGTIPHHLHTCDVTRPFEIKDRATGRRLRFDAITAWEVMEHIRDADLEAFCANLARHLADGGLFLCSVSTVDDGNPEVGAVYHQTVQPREWWVSRFRSLGFEVHEQKVIGKDDWLRGSGNCRLDRCAEDEGIGFHLVLRRRKGIALAAA
jgi:SAM-dependent methyltransferase/quinol monooxygenase YgiN